MRTYTIVVDESPDETLPGDMPPFPGVVIEGGSPEGCVDQGREAITLYLADLVRAGRQITDSPPDKTGLADEEAVDALRRAGAALDTVEAELLAELVRRQNPQDQADLRRAHVALLKARTALTGAEKDA
jgi:predicted RNase H-like HicB family nuclease